MQYVVDSGNDSESASLAVEVNLFKFVRSSPERLIDESVRDEQLAAACDRRAARRSARARYSRFRSQRTFDLRFFNNLT